MIAIERLAARAGRFTLEEVTFDVPQGGYGVVIGAAGSGKTTLLETIAGIRRQTGGRVQLGGRDVSGLPPEVRGIGFVYQHAFLFPHLTVEENISYGASDPAAARELAERLGAAPLLQRDVRSLSGGERQLVALARAIAGQPPVLLLDEPFSALDPRRRTLVRREVRSLHRERGMTVLQVTHDFTEAGLLGDVAILLDAGRVRRLEDLPPDWESGEAFVASAGLHALEFSSGSLTIHTVGDASEGSAYAVIRAEEVVIATESRETSMRNQFLGRVTEIATLGALTRVTVDVGGVPLVAALTTRSARELGLEEGLQVVASFKAMAVHLC